MFGVKVFPVILWPEGVLDPCENLSLHIMGGPRRVLSYGRGGIPNQFSACM